MPANLLAPEYAKLLSRQEYGRAPGIEGVVLQDLRRHVDDGGEFSELLRLAEDGAVAALPGVRPRQVNYSRMGPGVVKAFHLHERQEDVWFVPPEHKLVAGLLDCRSGSPTKGLTMRIVLGDGRSQLLLIPRGVAHGVANLGDRPAALLYFVTATFDPADPDELRLPPDLLGTDFWRVAPG